MPSWTKTPSQSAPTPSLMTSPSRKRRKSPVHARTCRPLGGRPLPPPVSVPLRLTPAATPSPPARPARRGGGPPPPPAGIGPAEADTGRDSVSTGDELLDDDLQVGERCVVPWRPGTRVRRPDR